MSADYVVTFNCGSFVVTVPVEAKNDEDALDKAELILRRNDVTLPDKSVIEIDETATCQICGRDLPEIKVNMVDYDVDICIDCEMKVN